MKKLMTWRLSGGRWRQEREREPPKCNWREAPEAVSPPQPSMRLHLSSSLLLLLPSSSLPLLLPTTITTITSTTITTIISLLVLPSATALPHLAPAATPPAPCGCITEAEASSLPAPSAKTPLVSVDECHQHCSQAPFFTFTTSHGR